ncbi:MAG: acetylglutamate kinase [Bacteroidota bacterium]|nr:acetylglutamate kinase [Bacteroidota bacterium]
MDVAAIRPVVIKIGGAVLENLRQFWPLIAGLDRPIVIIHGGGAQSTGLARRLGHHPRIVRGRRVTTDLDLSVAEWAMRGEVNLKLVAEGLMYGLNCVGLSGADGNLIRVRKREPWTIRGEVIDFGWVGEIERIDCGLLTNLLAGGYLPVIAPLGLGPGGHRYNVNADTVASVLATALKASELNLVTSTGGLRRHADQPDSLLAECTAATFEQGLQEGWITGGMRVKLEVAFDALAHGIPSLWIVGPDDLAARRNATRVILGNK